MGGTNGRLHDHLTGKMAAFEGIGGRDRHAPPRYQTPPANFATEPNGVCGSAIRRSKVDSVSQTRRDGVDVRAQPRSSMIWGSAYIVCRDEHPEWMLLHAHMPSGIGDVLLLLIGSRRRAD